MSKQHKQVETAGRLSRRRDGRELAARVGIVFALLAASSAMADQAWWTGLAGSAWNAGLTNWDTDATSGTMASALPSSSTDVFFSTLLPMRKAGSLTLGTDFSINSLTFTSRDGALSLGDSARTLTLSGSGGSGITVEGGSATRSIAADVLLGAPQTWTNNGATAITTLSVSGDIDATAPGGQLTIAGSGNTSLAGAIGSNITGGVVKTGGGVLSLGSNANSFSGGLTINGGVVQATDDRALGAAGSGVTLNGGGTLNLEIAGYTEMTLGAGRSITVNGSASNPSGLEVAGLLTTGAGQLQGNGALRISSSYPPSGGTTGELYVKGANPGFTGQLVIGTGKQLIGDYFSEPFSSNSVDIIVLLWSTGSLANSSGITVTQTGTLAISQSGATVTGRLGSAPLAFHSGRFTYSTNGNVAINDTFGNVAVTGQWKIVGFTNVTGPAGGTTLNFGNLNRADHATLLFLDDDLAYGGAPSATSLRVFFANLAPDITTSGLTRSVIPWASNAPTSFGAPNDLMTYDANGFRPLNVLTETTPPSSPDPMCGPRPAR